MSVLISAENGDRFPCSVKDYENIYAAAGISLLQRPTIGFTEFKDALTDRMVRDFYGSLWGGADVPAWFETGLARLYRTHAGYNELQIARAAGRTDTLLTFEDLASPLPTNSLERDLALWDAESYLLVLYLADQIRKDVPFQLAAEIAGSEGGFDDAWQKFTNTDLTGLWNAWNSWLFSDKSDQAVLWTPYMPAE